MAELNLKQIIDRLNAEFTGNTRKLVFWYDDKGEFAENMESVELEGAQIYYLKPDNQFYTKNFLERVDKTTNYLIYAPFPKPDVKDNHLEDMLLYSKRFFADRASLLSVDLGIKEKYKPIIEKHIKFFANKERTQRFYDLEISNFNEENILTGLLSALCKTRTNSFDEVLCTVLMENEFENNSLLEEMAKYDLIKAFWRLCEQQFGYIDENPSLEKLLITMFVTYTDRYITDGVPKEWKPFVSLKPGNNIAFLDNLMNNMKYRETYDELSAHVATSLNVESVLSKRRPEEMLRCDSFCWIDSFIKKWVTERLTSEDIGAKLDDLNILEVCDLRSKMHFGEENSDEYTMFKSAYELISQANYNISGVFKNIAKRYTDTDWKIDYEYRKFYYYHDKLNNTEDYEKLRPLVENIYTNEYLNKILVEWNKGIAEADSLTALPLQKGFYSRSVSHTKERTVVIISDAMRYEVGRELFIKMQDDPKCTAKMDAALSTLPSYTRLGMAALLPHRTLEMTSDYKIMADGVVCDSLATRFQVLQNNTKDSDCVQFDDIKALKKADLRDIFTGKEVVYVYHNQIDARGDKANTEDEVFAACEEAVEEIYDFIRRVSTNANTHRFIVTSDHGFIYKRDKLSESDKIGGLAGKEAFINRRFVVSAEPIKEDGVGNLSLGYILGNDDQRVISYPISSNVFKVPGGGQNFVHGGSSPQEMIIPVIDIKMDKGRAETKIVKIALVSMIQKITNLITTMDFIQSDPVTDTVRATTYKMVFIDENGDRISNENIYVADSRELDSSKRIQRMRFNFKNQKYDRSTQYYLTVYDANTEVELFRHPVMMDIAMADDFGW